MRNTIALLFILFVFFPLTVHSEKDRGVELLNKEEHEEERIKVGKQHLLLIAIDNYPKHTYLRGPVNDAIKLAKVLKRKYHIDKVKTFFNDLATKENIYDYIVSLQKDKEHGLKKEDSLFIYFGGHGNAFSKESYNDGYWIPYDGGNHSIAKTNWLSASELSGLLKKIAAKHVLIVSDSCFSGSLLESDRQSVSSNKKKYLKEIYKFPIRRVLTSGSLETVPGKSKFAELFIDSLENNRDIFIDILSIYMRIRDPLINHTGKVPAIGILKDTKADPNARFIIFTNEGWEKLITPINTKYDSLNIKSNLLKIRIRVFPWAVLYINDDRVGEIPPQRVTNVIEGAIVNIMLIKNGIKYFGEFYAESGHIHWSKKFSRFNVRIDIIESAESEK